MTSTPSDSSSKEFDEQRRSGDRSFLARLQTCVFENLEILEICFH